MTELFAIVGVSLGVGVLGAWSLRRARLQVRTEVESLRSELASLRTTDTARLRFLTAIAQELRTPLTLLLGQLDAALREGDPQARGHQLRVAARNARRLHRLADQTVTLSLLDAGALTAAPRSLEVVRYLELLVMSFAELAERREIRLDFFARPREIALMVDRDQLDTMASNLLSNALRHTPRGGTVSVMVELQATAPIAQGTPALLITVADTGSGIPAADLEMLFQRFGCGPGADPRHPGGAGIGLALARELARLNGGTITARSEVGRGATFEIHLPVDTAPPLAAGPTLLGSIESRATSPDILYRTTDPGGPALPTPDTDRPTLLVVDNNPDMRDWLSAALTPVGAVLTAENGTVALETAGDAIPDLVITDTRMSTLDGLELCRRLRSDERTSHIPIIMLSAVDSVERRVEGIQAGADEYLSKPIEARELQARASGLITTRRALRERFREHVIVTPSDVSTRSVDQQFFEKLTATIEANIDEASFSVPELAGEMALSTSQLTRKLRALIGQSPAQLIRSLRIQRGADLLAAGAGTVAEIAYQVGFADQGHFARTFKRQTGLTPGEHRKAAEQRPPS
jgi:signal transduction histidine kinase/DNA-binding response OmpR family regulator